MPSHCEWNGSQGWAADRTLRSQNELMWTTVIMYPTGTRSWTQSHCVKSKDTIFCVLLETNLGLLASPSIELGKVFNEKCHNFTSVACRQRASHMNTNSIALLCVRLDPILIEVGSHRSRHCCTYLAVSHSTFNRSVPTTTQEPYVSSRILAHEHTVCLRKWSQPAHDVIQ